MESKMERKKPEVPVSEKLAWTVDETAAMTNIGTQKLRSLNQTGELPCFFVGDKRLFNAEIVKEFLKNAAKKGINLQDL